ncbi:DEIH-box ATPase [Clavispora lusitaniae]|nr:DEIH-box ATPase [Clavispora lusitaniae]
MQTQCLSGVPQSNEITKSPRAMARFALAQLALLACWRQNKQRAVYIQPTWYVGYKQAPSVWRFSPRTRPKRAVHGDAVADARSAPATIYVGNRQFDAVSRRWRSAPR